MEAFVDDYAYNVIRWSRLSRNGIHCSMQEVPATTRQAVSATRLHSLRLLQRRCTLMAPAGCSTLGAVLAISHF